MSNISDIVICSPRSLKKSEEKKTATKSFQSEHCCCCGEPLLMQATQSCIKAGGKGPFSVYVLR